MIIYAENDDEQNGYGERYGRSSLKNDEIFLRFYGPSENDDGTNGEMNGGESHYVNDGALHQMRSVWQNVYRNVLTHVSKRISKNFSSFLRPKNYDAKSVFLSVLQHVLLLKLD